VAPAAASCVRPGSSRIGLILANIGTLFHQCCSAVESSCSGPGRRVHRSEPCQRAFLAALDLAAVSPSWRSRGSETSVLPGGHSSAMILSDIVVGVAGSAWRGRPSRILAKGPLCRAPRSAVPFGTLTACPGGAPQSSAPPSPPSLTLPHAPYRIRSLTRHRWLTVHRDHQRRRYRARAAAQPGPDRWVRLRLVIEDSLHVLDNGVTTALTATTRTGLSQFTSPVTTEPVLQAGRQL
jgi:hypothetical protein